MAEISPAEARNFIAEVREDNGGITPEDRDFLTINRPSALRALQKTRRQLADSIKIVVDNLYSKETRFLYELIQNAEDNSYSVAKAKGEKPFLAFRVYQDKIIVESNEDGFSERNIRAICSVGNSTKKQSAGYIGEKGIGFKSVFKVARKVHIQSGPFSFAFTHTRDDDDDDGLGMITPYHEDAEELAPGIRTRMTLTLLDPSKFEERASEFRAVPDTFLMFLNQLQQLSITLYGLDECPVLTHYSKRETEDNGLYTTFLTKTTQIKGKEESISEQKYYTMKSDLSDLPFDEARQDKQGNNIDRATVILAFPVDEHDRPVLKPQYTYAFLPLRQVGFKFLIQSDFVTQASREEVVHTGRNRAVLRGVANAFVDAMLVFCKRPCLKYQWMNYLPEDSISGEFWGTLWIMIRDKLQQTPILVPWSGNGLYKPLQLQKLAAKFIGEDGNPLLRDFESSEVYLSPKYTDAAFEILRRLGATTLQWDKFVDRLAGDLRNPSDFRWRSLTASNSWRTRICQALSEIFVGKLQPSTEQQKRLRTLDLIPLNHGSWISSASKTKVYFPNTGDVLIPTDLGFDLAHPAVIENVAWARFLSTLGVKTCSSDDVINSINIRYGTKDLKNFTIADAVAHIRYLYWFLPKDTSSLAPQIRFVNQHGALLRKDQYLYFPEGEGDYSPPELFKKHAQLLGLSVNYLHGDYLTAVNASIVHNGLSWIQWLEKIAGVHRRPVLRATDSQRLSSEFRYIIKHRSERLLGTLRCGLAHYRPLLTSDLRGQITESRVRLENGQLESLECTYLPFPRLKSIAVELRVAEAFPFVAVSESVKDEEKTGWAFVQQLSVGIEEDLQFYLNALKSFQQLNPKLDTASAGDQLVRIYRNIQSKCSENLDEVLQYFHNDMIWTEPSHRNSAFWVSAAECVWDGPPWLKSKQRLKFGSYLELEPLFKTSLKIQDASQADVLKDLLLLKSNAGNELARGTQFTKRDIESVKLESSRIQIGTIGAPYQDTAIRLGNGETEICKSITIMAAYQKQSFEELRLADYDRISKRSAAEKSRNKSKTLGENDPSKTAKEAEKRYNFLWQNYSHPANEKHQENREALQFAFEHDALVYIPDRNGWSRPSECVWVESTVKIPGKFPIAAAYPTKKLFFTEILNVPEPTVQMYIESLKAEADGNARSSYLKEIMALICGLGIERADLSSLAEVKFLPVRLMDGKSTLASASTGGGSADFTIMDNTAHRDAFAGKITTLDFSFEEIRDTRPLLSAMGLDGRFSSKLVKEVTDVSGGSPDHQRTKSLRNKSQAIVRCAYHFASLDKRPNPASLYRKSRRTMVHVSGGIRQLLQITQSGRTFESTSSRANFHIEEDRGMLRLYLPKDEIEFDICLESDLPRRLCAFLNITDPGATSVVGSVFRKDNLAVIDKVLEKAGVSQVDCDFAALDAELGSVDDDLDTETLVEAVSSVGISSPGPRPRLYTPSGRTRWNESQSSNTENIRNTSPLSHADQEQQTEPQDAAYKSVLENVVNIARQRVHSGIFETIGLPVQGRIANNALPLETVREAFVARGKDRDFKLGAAGELYMFEYLQGLDLPEFSLRSWKSGIRDCIKVHPAYQGLEGHNDRSAIADIEYQDISGRFTQFLIGKGVLERGLWNNKTPLYHMEIKTTTNSNWQEPFYMSKYQEKHIQNKRIEDGRSSSSIYLICRIFNLGKGDDTGMFVYVDPETRRRNQELEFSTHTWALRPLSHPRMLPDVTAVQTTAETTSATTAGMPSSSTTESSRTEPPNNRTGTDRDLKPFSLFGMASTSTPSVGTSTFSRPNTSLFTTSSILSSSGPSQPAATGGLNSTRSQSSNTTSFGGSNHRSANSTTFKSPFLGLFDPNAPFSNSGIANATPSIGLFGSGNAIPSTASKAPSTSTFGSPGSGSFNSTTSKAQSRPRFPFTAAGLGSTFGDGESRERPASLFNFSSFGPSASTRPEASPAKETSATNPSIFSNASNFSNTNNVFRPSSNPSNVDSSREASTSTSSNFLSNIAPSSNQAPPSTPAPPSTLAPSSTPAHPNNPAPPSAFIPRTTNAPSVLASSNAAPTDGLSASPQLQDQPPRSIKSVKSKKTVVRLPASSSPPSDPHSP